ncbi:hypothetical protein H0H93_004507 [Arthromyces matolae]|nr:hypothetical protein H0H93_004507 [Arthromyces matolae]
MAFMLSLRRARSNTLGWQKYICRTISYSVPSHRALPFSLNSRGINDDHELDSSRFLRMLMFGKPGAGKGTLSSRLVGKYDILSLSTGDLLRQHIAERTEVGREAEETVARGGLIPDEIMLKVVTSKLDSLHNKHWILDGFPRTLGQAKLLDTHLKTKNTPLTFVVNIDVPDDIILSRISDRWVHLPSGRVYNMSYNKPKVEGYDDITGEPLTKRPDDNPHPHQVTFHRPQKRIALETLAGATSDENWPVLDRAVRSAFPTLRKRVSLRDIRRNDLKDAILSDRIDASL